MSDELLSLNCLIWGDEVEDAFQLTLPKKATVDALKEAIKEKSRPDFDNIRANKLEIYRTSKRVASWPLDDGEGLKEAVANDSHGRLSGRGALSAAFNQPVADDGIHILVKPPSTYTAPQPTISINCLVVGDKRNHIFAVDLAGTQKVSHLKDAIKHKKQNAFRDVDADHLEVFRISLPNDGELENKVRNLKFNEPLQPTSLLADIFTDLSVENLHIVVRRVDEIEEEGGVNEEQGDILAQLHESFKRTITPLKASPSQAAKSSEYRSIQRGIRRILDCRHPHDGPATVAPPIQLFNPAFAYFTSKAFDHEYYVPPDFVLRVCKAVKLFAVINTNESSRRARLKETIEEILDRQTIYAGNSDKTSPDGVVFSRDQLARLVVYEEKNEFGEGHSDPSTQGAFSYLRIFCQDENRTLLKTCCPVFIVAHAGAWLTILGGVITSKCIVQRLTDFVWVPVHSTHDDDHWLRIARIFYVLKESIGRLESWYKSNKEERSYNFQTPTPHPRFFPSVHTFPQNGVEVRFKYAEPLENDQTCVTYLAETIEPLPRKIVVKFVTRYGIDAHLTMANAGFAPKVHYFGAIGGTEDAVSYGQLKMVVMDYVEGVTLSTAIKQKKVPASVATHLAEAINHLHGAGFVFGDLRGPNVIVTPSDEITVRLIDFDWAGKIGEVKYPVLINKEIEWAEGVEPLGLIDKEHDRSNFNSIVADFPRQKSRGTGR